MRPVPSAILCVVVLVLASAPEVVSFKKFPTATRPPVPPPPPPLFRFSNPGERKQTQTFEMIAPNQIQQGFKPHLTAGSPDFNVGVASGTRPQSSFQQRPQAPFQPQKPQQQVPRPPMRPFSQPLSRPTATVPPRPQRPAETFIYQTRPREVTPSTF